MNKKDKIEQDLFALQDLKYRDFQAKLIPNISKQTIIGVRAPALKNYAKQIIKAGVYSDFLNNLPHTYLEENALHSCIVNNIKDFSICIKEVERFLPYIDNWAICDGLSPKCFHKNTDELLVNIKKWLKSKKEYTMRFAIGMLMQHYLDENFKEKYLLLVAGIKREEYYIKMMQAWFFATSLAKQYEQTIIILQNNQLEKWTHNKTIQKSIESYRITDEQKAYLKSLRRK